MKYLVATVFIVGTFLVVCDAACFRQHPEKSDEPPQGNFEAGFTTVRTSTDELSRLESCQIFTSRDFDSRPWTPEANWEATEAEYLHPVPYTVGPSANLNYPRHMMWTAQLAEGCRYKGKLYELGETWRTKRCMDCSCFLNGGMECCQAYGTPFSNDENCVFKFDKKACKYDLVPNEDPEKQCSSYSMVG